jgi:hypothetical protein
MKIFSNFDTQRKKEAINEMIEKYGEKNVLLLWKSFLFLFVKVLFPVFWWFIAIFWLRAVVFFNMWNDMYIIKILFSVFMWLLYRFILLISSVIKYYIDYKMDFSIVTPEYLTRYNQTWFFKRDIKSSYVRNIKTITIVKNDILYNIFNNWNLIFLSEGDRENEWEIVLHYIQNPEKKKKEIIRIMKTFN